MRRFLMALPALALALTATYAQAGGCGWHRARCRPAPCANACSPCGGGHAVAAAPACGPTYQTVERTVMVPEQVQETRTVTVTK